MSFFCHCRCNDDGFADIAEKVICAGAGAGVATLGLALTIASCGVAAPIGGAIMGAGISSTWHGFEKMIDGERISKRSYCADVGFGAVSGLVTGGIGAAGETIAANAVKQGAKVGAKKLAVRAVTGAVAGFTSKAVDEVKQCSTTNKQWSDYGKNFDAQGNQNGTVFSWVTSAAVGGLGGASTHVSSNLTKFVPTGVAKSVTRVAVSAGTAAASDATMQGINMATGLQDTYDGRRTLISAATSAGMAAAQEGMKNTLYRANGGKAAMLVDEANKETIKQNAPEEIQQTLMDVCEDLKQIPEPKSMAEAEKATAYTEWQKKEADGASLRKEYDSKIDAQSRLKQNAIVTKNIPKIQEHQENMMRLQEEKKVALKPFNDVQPTVKKADFEYIGDKNIHFLVDDKVKQVAVDVSSPLHAQSTDTGAGTPAARPAARAIFDHHRNPAGKSTYAYSGYTADHRYEETPTHGKSRYYNVHQGCESDLSTKNRVVNFVVQMGTMKPQEERKEE